MLVLFDVDGTLLMSHGAGRAAMERAGTEVVGRPLSAASVPFAGMLDPAIWRAICTAHHVDGGERLHAAFRARYVECFRDGLASGAAPIEVLPGVASLLDALEARSDVVLGVLSGNYGETGRMKIDAAGLLADRFLVSAWGDEAPTRHDLVPLALSRCETSGLGRHRGQDVVVVGDTPADVACGRAHGCRVLAVATGWTPAAELAAAGADLVLDDLSDHDAVLEWLACGAGAR